MITFPAFSVIAKKESEPKVIKFFAAHGPIEVITKPLKIFKQEVEEKTQGRIKVELVISDSGQDYNLKTEKEVLRLIQNNEYQMSQLYTKSLVQFEKNFSVLEVPFLFKDHEHSFATVDGEIGKELFAGLEKNSNLKGLGYTYSGGYRFISTKNKEIHRMEDFKGLKIAAGTEASSKILNKLGIINFKNLEKIEIRGLVRTDKIDGLVTVFPRYFHNSEYKISSIANEIFFNIQFTALTINKQFFNSLSESDQKIIQESAQKISVMERKIAVDIANDVDANGKNYGIKVVRMTPAENRRITDYLNQFDWVKELNINADILKRIKEIKKSEVISHL